jgi:citrate lyase subunit beta/citryl-CoA lyase
MVRRSVLFSPGDQPDLMRKAPSAGADVVVFDLEDAVAPGQKDEARQAVNDVLSDPDFDPDCEVCVRVNPVGAGAGADVEAVLSGRETADSVMLPKAGEGEDVETLGRLLAEADTEAPVLALVESARGVLNAQEIAVAGPTDALVFGAEDLSADVGATRTEEGTEVLHAREHVVLAASAAGVDAIDTVYTDIEDTEGLAEETRFAAGLGFDGKMAIHPAQVDPINDAYTPAPEDVEWAERVMEAKAEADEDGRGVFRVDGEMVDAPLVAQAERVLERARAADPS